MCLSATEPQPIWQGRLEWNPDVSGSLLLNPPKEDWDTVERLPGGQILARRADFDRG